jgi:hypothetical protein
MKCIICENDMEAMVNPDYKSSISSITTLAYISYQCKNNSCKASGWNYGHSWCARDNEIFSYNYYIEQWESDHKRYHIWGNEDNNETLLEIKNHKYQYDPPLVSVPFISFDYSKNLKIQAEDLLKRLKGLIVFS